MTSLSLSVRRVGFTAALATAILAAVSFGIAVNTPPISGPLCLVDCQPYPFADVAAWIPHDYIWMYPAILLQIATLIMILTLHEAVAPARRVFSRIAGAFALLGTGLLVTDYYVQIAVLQPSLLAGETGGVALLSQYNDHGLFIALEDISYFLLGVTFLFCAPLFWRDRGVGRVLFWLLLLAGTGAVVAWPVMYAIYRYNLSYRYEILAISIVWSTLLLSGLLLSRWFMRKAATPAV